MDCTWAPHMSRPLFLGGSGSITRGSDEPTPSGRHCSSLGRTLFSSFFSAVINIRDLAVPMRLLSPWKQEYCPGARPRLSGNRDP